ncbi:MAG: C39 family peptidase [Candidatus Magasanikbacteria bacterium]|nr:C39 family peptidase [Candidatus Magasanikbacteria bacterium]
MSKLSVKTILLFVFALSFWLGVPPANAQTNEATTYSQPSLLWWEVDLKGKRPTLEINIPGLNLSRVVSNSDETGTFYYIPWIPELIGTLYKFGIAIVSIVAVITIILQGVRITTSGGGEQKNAAYKKIGQAVIGLLIAWGSFAILYNINPATTEFNALKVKIVERQELEVSPSYEDEVDVSDAPGTGQVPYFGQYDPRWAKLKPGDEPQWPFDTSKCTKGFATIKERGCGPTSMAMILKYLGKDVTPIDTAQFSLGCTGAMISADKIQKAWGQGQWSDLKFEPYINRDRALTLATQNIPIIFNCHPCVGYTGDNKLKTYSGHYMVITGSSDGGQTFNINDPGGNPKINSAIVKMTKDQILNPQNDQAVQGCSFYSDATKTLTCVRKIEIKKPSFIYIHK